MTKEKNGQPQGTASKESNNNDFVSRYGNLFLWVLLGFCIAFGIFLVCANCEFRKSQEKIKQSYEEHIKKADSLYLDIISYKNEYISHISDANATILTDSLIRLTLGPKQRLSAEQYNRLHALLITQFEEIKQLHEKYDGKIQRDSLQLMTERQLLEGQVKTMLDLHLNKIEHEYSNITLWAAVLTILFLVFSFYSIFKMDSLVHQGNEGVREIRKLSLEGEKTIQDVTNKGETLIANSKEKINQLVEETQAKLTSFIVAQQQIVSDTVNAVHAELNEIKSESDKSKTVAASTKVQIDGMLEESLELLKEKLSEIENQYSQELKTKVENLNEYIDKLQSVLIEWEQNQIIRNPNNEVKKGGKR